MRQFLAYKLCPAKAKGDLNRSVIAREQEQQKFAALDLGARRLMWILMTNSTRRRISASRRFPAVSGRMAQPSVKLPVFKIANGALLGTR